MAPNKKKKKPASNPARGFATTSIASKPKNDGTSELNGGEQLGDKDAHAIINTSENGTRPNASSDREPEKALYELTPEELESQLENSSLQILVENFGETTKKGASRHASRLQTEKRLLRSQAEHIRVFKWLPPEIMQIITDLLQIQECSIGNLHGNIDSKKLSPPLCEDDLLIKLWALKRLLPLLGFTEERTDLALRHLLTTLNKSGPQSVSSAKDMIWGFDECLTWLALTSDSMDLPTYDIREGLSNPSVDHLRSEIVTPATTPTDSRPESPHGEVNIPQQAQISSEDHSLSAESDSDDDAEPEQLVTKYLELQSRLHQISPDLTDIITKRHRQVRPKVPLINDKLDSDQKRRIARLTAKIDKIKSDLLFDEAEATSRWTETRLNLAQEAAERRRFGVGTHEEEQKFVDPKRSNANLADSNDDDDDTDAMLGGFFSGLPDTVTDPATGLSIVSTTSQEGITVEIRNFGHWSGISPRRVLEEACKARLDFQFV